MGEGTEAPAGDGSGELALRFGPMELGAAGIAVAIISFVTWYRFFRGPAGRAQ